MSPTIPSVKNSPAISPDAASSCDALLDRFLSLFPIRHNSAIRRGNGAWRTISQFHYLSDEEIVESLKNGAQLQRACPFDIDTRFAAIQIPAGSRYHGHEGVCSIRTALGEIGQHIKVFHYREDSYLYIFFDEPLPSHEVSAALSDRLIQKGIEISSSTIVIHPTDTALPLPLQPGFAWVNDDGLIIVSREDISLESAVSLFLFDSEKNAVTETFFFRALAEACSKVEETCTPSLCSSVSDACLASPPAAARRIIVMHHGVCQLSGLLSLLRRPLGKSPRVRVREPSRLKTPPLLNVSAPPRASPQTLPGALASFSLLRRLPIEPC